jgi:signal transduction histidine kinase
MSNGGLRETTRSFSFRMGALLFATVCAALMTFRLIIYYESVEAAYGDTQAIIEAHEQEIDEAVTRYGVNYVKILIREILKDPPDRRFYIAFRDADEFMGNIAAWPPVADPSPKWQEVSVPQGEGKKPLRLLITTRKLRNKAELLIGYDLYRIDIAKHGLLEDMAENIVISLIVAGLLSVAIVWLINRQFLKINRTCDAVIAGKLSRRVPVRRANDQFDRLGLNINKMLDWITMLLGTVRDSTNALAHDMRTPLSFHRLELQAIAGDPEVPVKVRDKMREAVTRLDAVVEMFDNILSISKAESRSGTELFASLNLAETVRDIVYFYAPLFEERNHALLEDIPETPFPFYGDEQLIKQAVVNLIDNSIKYTPEGGCISVSLRASGDNRRAVLTVADNGPGIEADLREKAKERFFRLDKARNTRGSGLGLSLVNAVAGLHQGTFTLEDNAPGLKAVLDLPFLKKEATDV